MDNEYAYQTCTKTTARAIQAGHALFGEGICGKQGVFKKGVGCVEVWYKKRLFAAIAPQGRRPPISAGAGTRFRNAEKENQSIRQIIHRP